MRIKKGWRTLVMLLALTATISCKRTSVDSSTESSQRSRGYFQTQFQDESQFIIEAIVSDLAEQIFYAKHQQLPDPKYFSVTSIEKPDSPRNAPTYNLTVVLNHDRPALQFGLDINGPIWSPDLYQSVAVALGRQIGFEVSPRNVPDNSELLLALTDGAATTIERENRKLSKALQADFANVALHEQAAALLGAFALREHSGDFYDIRSPLCQITAQLAVAQYLSGGKSFGINGRMAEAMSLGLMNDQAAALVKLDGIETNDPAVNCWVGTLKAYDSGDYRPLAATKDLSLIERIAWFRAFARSVDDDVAWGQLTKDEKETVDFSRIANEQNYSVGTGHQLLAVSLPSELKEIIAVYEFSKEPVLTKKNLAEKLNEMPGRCFVTAGGTNAEVRVIGWGQWAMFFQRQLGHAMEQNFDFLENKWGVPDDAQKFTRQNDQLFETMWLYPFVRRFNCTDEKSYHSAEDDGMRVTVTMPQLTPAGCWNYLCYTVPFAALYHPNPNPHVNEWHKHNPPPGTAYDPLPRFNHPSLVNQPDTKALVANLHALAPYDRDVTFNFIRLEYDQQPSYEQCADAYKMVLPYATYAMAAVANTVQDQPDRYEALMSRASALDPARYYNLGEYFQGRQLDEKAAEYFELGNERCSDSVNAASHAGWLVRYYLKKGKTQKARGVADVAGAVYSTAGLEAKAEFFELTGDYNEALAWFLKIDARYGDPNATLGFCLRYELQKIQSGDEAFDSGIRNRVAGTFPEGLQMADLKDFAPAPTDGVLIERANDIVQQAGLNQGDVIVAISGVRIHNLKQYMVGREINSQPDLDLIVWQGRQYQEIKARPPNRSFGAKFSDYSAK